MNKPTKEFVYKRLKEALFSEAKDSCDLNRKEKDKECIRAIAISRCILNSIDKETLIEYIIALRWQILERNNTIEKASNKLLDLTIKNADLTIKNAEFKKRLNVILGKKEGEQNE